MIQTYMEKEILTPREIITIKGKLHYSEANQAWNILKLKTEFLNEFQQLKQKRSNFSYELVFGRSGEEMVKLLKESVKTGGMIPVLMFLYKD